jgi:DNA-binding CsgD family transcriptional regulator
LAITGLIRARRGDPDPWSPLDEAADRARHSGELQWVAPVTAARLEAGWLDGTGGERGEDSSLVLRDCEQRRAGWWAGEIAWWRRCCGLSDPLPGQVPAPWALLLAGRGREAAAAWHEIGCPYEEGVSLASTNDPDDLRAAFERFDCLGARPAATLTAKRMRSLGVAVPRGVRRSTRDNPAGLTAREMEVLQLISQGLHNSEIAADLVVSPKTVEHHVSAVLRKLGVNDRRSASRMAGSIGIGDQRIAPLAAASPSKRRDPRPHRLGR